jgi:NAD(P)-dependent dehydrogenase (short-subunit alcohol dehydrogenase family)
MKPGQKFNIAEDLAGKVAWVTGAARGIGRAVVEALAARGAAVVVNDLDQAAIDSVAAAVKAQGASAIALAADVRSAPAVQQLVQRVVAQFGSLHILVNCAGCLRPTPVDQISPEEWDWVVDVNLKGTFLCSQAALAPMRQARWGRIVAISSTAGKNVSTIGGAHYTAAKAGVLGLTRHMAKESAAAGITVNAICPGLIDTDMVRSTIDASRIAEYASGFPIARLGTPEEVAQLVAFLCSDRAAYITGASLDINGGDLMI